MNGIINLYKPSGITSFDAVERVKRLVKERKVGHGGTLDPLASGVLPIFLDQATRLMEYMSELSKTYRAVVELGVVTDSYDAEGEVILRRDASGITLEAIEEALQPFRGKIEQAPPSFSAIKQKGTPAYKLARQGRAPIMEKRPVNIYRLELVEFEAQHLTLEIECSKGTYIRSLAYDIGEALGCGGYLRSLVRTSYGPFNITDAVALPLPGESSPAAEMTIHPMETILSQWTAVALSGEQALAVEQGKPLELNIEGERVRAHDQHGRFMAILYREAKTKLWQPHKVFLAHQGEPRRQG